MSENTGKHPRSAQDDSAITELLEKMHAYWASNFSQAKSCAEMAYELACKRNDLLNMAKALDGMAVCHWYIGDYSNAISYSLNALRMMENSGLDVEKQHLIGILNNLGMSQFQLKDHEAALRTYLRSLALSLMHGTEVRVVVLLNNLGGIYWILKGDFAGVLEQAVKNEFREPPEYGPHISPEMKNLLERLLFPTGEEDVTDVIIDAYSYFIKEDMVTVMNKATLRLNIGLIHQEKQRHEAALEMIQEALHFCRANNLIMVEPLIQQNLGLAYRNLGFREEALEHLNEGLRIATEQNELQHQYGITQSIAIIQEQLERPREALEAMKSAHDYYKRFLDEQKNRQIAQLELKYDSDKRRRESMIAEQKAEIYRLRNEELTHLVNQRTQQVLQMEKLYEVGKFAASIVHNLNGPLTTLFGVLEAIDLMELEMPGHMREYHELLHSSALNMKQMIQSITRSVRANVEAADKSLDINHILRAALEFRRFDKSRIEKLNVSLNLAESLPQVRGRETHFLQIFDNLLHNAFDALELSTEKRLELTTRCKDDGVEVVVSDSGCGIQPEHVQRIFDLDFTTKEPGKGTGLGLSITRQMVEAYQGRIQVDSEPGRGASFTLWFPAEKNETEESPE